MKLAFLSDIHGNLPALEAVLADLARERVDQVFNLGDILAGPLWPRETAQRLMALGWPTIAGNHERQMLTQPRERQGASDAFASAQITPAQRAWLAGLPGTRSPALVPDLFCCHGTPTNDLQYLLETVTGGAPPGLRAATADELATRLAGTPEGATLVACGHSHVPRVQMAGARLLLNPGSVGLPAFEDAHAGSHVVEAGSPHARWALVEARAGAGAARWHVQLRLTPYDWDAAAARAEANGRGDWADALRSGRMGRREADLETMR